MPRLALVVAVAATTLVALAGAQNTPPRGCYPVPLGMESGDITDDQLSAANSWNQQVGDHGPRCGRLNGLPVGGCAAAAWAAADNSLTLGTWYQVDPAPIVMGGFIQSRGAAVSQRVTSLSVHIANDTLGPWTDRRLHGRGGLWRHCVPPLLLGIRVAQYIRFIRGPRGTCPAGGLWVFRGPPRPKGSAAASQGRHRERRHPDRCGAGARRGRVAQHADLCACSVRSALTSICHWDAEHTAKCARLNIGKATPRRGPSADRLTAKDNWVQVDLGRPRLIVGVITQGRDGHNQWVTSYHLSYSNTTSDFAIVRYDDKDHLFQGNFDQRTEVMHYVPVTRARYWRIIPQAYFGHQSLRMELLSACRPATTRRRHVGPGSRWAWRATPSCSRASRRARRGT